MLDKAKEAIANLRNFLDSSQNKIIYQENRELFNKIIGYTEYCFIKEIDIVNDEYKIDIQKSFDFLISIYTDMPISDELTDFVFNYTLLIFNMDSNITKDKQIQNRCELVERLYKDYLSLKEIFYFTKELINKYKNLMNYALPSVEISKHYLESFNVKESPIIEEKKEIKEDEIIQYSNFNSCK